MFWAPHTFRYFTDNDEDKLDSKWRKTLHMKFNKRFPKKASKFFFVGDAVRVRTDCDDVDGYLSPKAEPSLYGDLYSKIRGRTGYITHVVTYDMFVRIAFADVGAMNDRLIHVEWLELMETATCITTAAGEIRAQLAVIEADADMIGV